MGTVAQPKVLVGIVTHNRAEILPKAIESALSQKGCHVQVSVIDDASTDETPELAKRYPQVEWIRWDPNRGYMEARNLWMSRQDVDYFVSLDDDSWFLEEDEIALALEQLESQESLAAIAYDILSPDRPDSVAREQPRAAGVFIGCGHVLKLSVVQKIGVYEAVPGSYGGEEKDLCLRLIDSGYEIVFLPGVHVWHDKTMVARDFAAQHRSVVCNDLVMAIRRTPFWLLPLVLAAKSWRHLLHAWNSGMTQACFEGFGMFARAAESAFNARQAVSFKGWCAYRKLAR